MGRKTSKNKIKILMTHVEIGIDPSNYEFPGVNYTGLSLVVLIEVS